MQVAKGVPRILGAVSVLLFGPLLGILIGFVGAAFSLPPDPNFEANGGHAAPGDGILIMLCVLVSLVITVPLSLAGAAWMLFRPTKSTPDQNEALGVPLTPRKLEL